MAAYYLDTSALARVYAREAGTAWVTALVDPPVGHAPVGHALYTVRLTGPEIVAALARKARTGELTPAEATRAIQAFRQDWAVWYRVLSVTPTVTERAMDLVERHGLRGYDAVHLAAALAAGEARRRGRLSPLTFVSADNMQCQTAVAEGLLVQGNRI